ncbi:MAG: hypothetical protein GKR94_19940 [Gammaproteobacteria bacterium]|nr:hypothetical protein [Gammaproteobacteria bacterium]
MDYSHSPIIDLIGNTRTDAGLRVRAELDKEMTATDAEMDALSLHRNEFHGDWNYELHPRRSWKPNFDQDPYSTTYECVSTSQRWLS